MPTHTRVESGMAQDQRWISNFFGRPDQRWHVRPKPGGWQTDPNMQPGGVCHHWSEVHLLSRCSERSCQVHQRFDPRTGTPPPLRRSSRKMTYVRSKLWQRWSCVLPGWGCAVTPHTTALCPRGSSSHVSSCPAKMEKEKTSVFFIYLWHTHHICGTVCVCVCGSIL